MGLARGVAIRPVDFQIPVLQLPFEQIYSQMQQMQQEKDTFEAMQGMLPQYVEADREKVIAGAQFVKDVSTDVAKKFAAGNVRDAMGALRGAKESVAKMWSPTGVFGATQGFYDDYQKAIQEVDEFTKGNTDPSYNYVYKRMVQKAAEQGSQFDPTTGKRSTVSAPDMLKEVDVLKEFMEFGKGWGNEADQTVGIEKYGDYYYYIGTDKKVPPEEVRAAWNSFISSPKIQSHLRIQASYETAMMGDNAEDFRDQLIMDAQTTYNNQKKQLDIVEQMLNSSSVNTRKQAQRELGVATDGIVGEETKKALSNLRSELDGQLEEARSLYESADIENLVKNRLERTMGNAAVKRLDFSQKDGKLVARQDMLNKQRLSYQRKLLQEQYELDVKNNTPLFDVAGAYAASIPNVAVAMQEGADIYKGTYNKLFSDNPELAKAIKSMTGNRRYAEALPSIVDALREAQTGDGKIDQARFTQAMRNRGFKDGEANPSYKGPVVTWSNLVQQVNDNLVSVNDFENASETLQGPYAAYMDSKAVVESFANAVENDNAVDWNKLKVVDRKSIKTKLEPGELPVTRNFTPQELKEEFRKGNLDVIKAVTESLGQDKLKGYVTISTATAFTGGVAANYDKLIVEHLKSTPGAFLSAINPEQLEGDSEIANAIGLKRQAGGKYTIDPTLQVTNIKMSTASDNGRNVNIATVQYTTTNAEGKKVPGTIELPDYAMNPQFLADRYVGIASSYLNRDGSIKDESAFLNVSANMFDLTNGPTLITNEAAYRNRILANRNTVVSHRVNLPSVRLSDGRIGAVMDVSAATMIAGTGQIMHVYGRDAAAYYIQQAGNDFAKLQTLLESAPQEVRAAIVAKQVGTYSRDSEGHISSRSIKVDQARLSDAIYDMKGTLNFLDTQYKAIDAIGKKRVKTGPQFLQSIDVSSMFEGTDEIDE